MSDATPEPKRKPIPKRVRFEVLRRDGHACRYCGQMAPDVKLTIDHVVPVSLGGTDDPSNLVSACVDCNAGKTSTSPDERIVDDVAADALRWAGAMQRAAEIVAARDEPRRKYLAAFGPFPVAGADAGWRWRARGYEVDGDFWPTEVQVALKWETCHHEADPGDLGPLREWEPTPCDCWPVRPAPFDAVPVGGLRAHALRGVHTSLALEQMRAMADNAARLDITPRGLEGMVERVTSRGRRPGPGRPSLPTETHLRRLRVLSDTYAAGRGQDAAARRLKISEATLRRTLEWAREHGYWTKGHKGERGRLTARGEAAVEAIKGRRSR